MLLAVLASTNGSNLPSFFAHAKQLGISCILLTNKENCGAVQKAQDAGVESIFIDPTGKTREEFDTHMLHILQKKNVEHIFCIGYMRIISSVLTKAFAGKIYNIHPSLLPAFSGGMDGDVHEQVLKKGCKVSGATLHIITDAVDEGPILLQKSCTIEKNETPNSLKAKVQHLEKGMLISYLEYLQTGYLPRDYHSLVPSVYCVLEKEENILLLERKNTGYGDGMFSLPAGHVEATETFIQTSIREAQEEIGVVIESDNCQVVHMMQRASRSFGDPERISIFVKIAQWKGEPFNAEPEKCEKILWCKKNSLPENILPEVRFALKKIQQGIFYSEWK